MRQQKERESIPEKVNRWVRWVDLWSGRIEGSWLHRRGFVEGYSGLALWLAIPVLVLVAWGPIVFLRYRGLAATLLPLIALGALLLICRLRGRIVARLQWLLFVVTAIAIFWSADMEARAADGGEPYRHLLLVVIPIVASLGIPASRFWADRVFKSARTQARAIFPTELVNTQLFTDAPVPAVTAGGVIRALTLVPLTSLMLMLILPSLIVVFFPRVPWWIDVAVLLFAWAALGVMHFSSRLGIARSLLRQAFAVGGAGVVTAVVIVVALLAILDVQYVTTVLDATSFGVLAAWISSFYLIFWCYDYWVQRAKAEVLLGLLHQSNDHPVRVDYPHKPEWKNPRVQIHGAGRFIAIREVEEKRQWNFESYQPLDVFREIRDQLEGVARQKLPSTEAEATEADAADGGPIQGNEKKARWARHDQAHQLVSSLEQRERVYSALPAAVMLIGLLAAGVHIFTLTQRPGATVREAPQITAAPVNLVDRLLETDDGAPALMVAASGGGTRAALWAYAVLRELQRSEQLENVSLLSGVSGGSAGIAYFAAHRRELIGSSPEDPAGQATAAWRRYRCAMAEAYIEEVLAGASELRFLQGERLGKLLAEAFQRRFFDGTFRDYCREDSELVSRADRTQPPATPSSIGLLFNTAVAGSFRPEENADEIAACMGTRKWLGLRQRTRRDCATVREAGSRLVFSNLENFRDGSACHEAADAGWPHCFDYKVARDPQVDVATAAALSANFPPVFSNAAVELAGGKAGREERYWITDGGAVENRGLVTLLAALRAELAARLATLPKCPEPSSGAADRPPCGEGEVVEKLALKPIRILVAEASGSSVAYGEDRGVGAEFAASAQIANSLIGELLADVRRLYSQISGEADVKVVVLEMPDVLRQSGAVGTHWMMQASTSLSDPKEWYRKGQRETVSDDQLLDIVDAVLLPREQRLRVVREFASRTADWLHAEGDDPSVALHELLSKL